MNAPALKPSPTPLESGQRVKTWVYSDVGSAPRKIPAIGELVAPVPGTGGKIWVVEVVEVDGWGAPRWSSNLRPIIHREVTPADRLP